MQHGLRRIKGGFPLSLRLIREIHAILLRGGRGANKTRANFAGETVQATEGLVSSVKLLVKPAKIDGRVRRQTWGYELFPSGRRRDIAAKPWALIGAHNRIQPRFNKLAPY